MKNENRSPGSGITPVAKKKDDSAKLISLLALASGAVAMPQTGNADIIYTDLTSSPAQVGVFASPSFVINNLPGTAQLGFQFGQVGDTSFTSVRAVRGLQNAGYVRLKTQSSFVIPVAPGLVWNQIPGSSFSTGTAGIANYGNHAPNSFSDQYFAFKFKDSTQGNLLRYGWVQVSLNNGNLNSFDGPTLTISGYAFDNSGAQIPMGVVPEPAPLSLLALGALALGAKGLRSWRRQRIAANES